MTTTQARTVLLIAIVLVACWDFGVFQSVALAASHFLRRNDQASLNLLDVRLHYLIAGVVPLYALFAARQFLIRQGRL